MGDWKMNKRSRYYMATALCLTTVMNSTGVLAQDSTTEKIFELEEITVTAQKRAQSVQDVATAISAFSGDMLDKINAVNVTDMSAAHQTST